MRTDYSRPNIGETPKRRVSPSDPHGRPCLARSGLKCAPPPSTDGQRSRRPASTYHINTSPRPSGAQFDEWGYCLVRPSHRTTSDCTTSPPHFLSFTSADKPCTEGSPSGSYCHRHRGTVATHTCKHLSTHTPSTLSHPLYSSSSTDLSASQHIPPAHSLRTIFTNTDTSRRETITRADRPKPTVSGRDALASYLRKALGPSLLTQQVS